MRCVLVFIALLLAGLSPPTLADCSPEPAAPGFGDGLSAPEVAELLREIESQAADGDPDAQYEIGWLYFEGRQVERDYRKAQEWFLLAAEQDEVFSQEVLGDMFSRGLGVTRDDQAAIEWYRRAADQWLATAQYKLGLIYLQGDGVEADFREGYKYLKYAAAQGYGDAQLRLGDMYERGLGVEVDDALAYMWFYIPALGGCEEAIARRDRARERLNLFQAWAMRFTASDCIENHFQGC